MSKGNGIDISVGNGRLTIIVPVTTLVIAFENDPKNETFDDASGEFRRPKIINRLGFLGDLVHELDREQEDGTTPIHTAIDAAMRALWEGGSEHVEVEVSKPFVKR